MFIYCIYVILQCVIQWWYSEIIRRFWKDCQSSFFFAASCFYNLFRIYLSFFPGVEKTHRKAGTTELCLPGEAMILQKPEEPYRWTVWKSRCTWRGGNQQLRTCLAKWLGATGWSRSFSCSTTSVRVSEFEFLCELLSFRDYLMEDPFMLHRGMRHVT